MNKDLEAISALYEQTFISDDVIEESPDGVILKGIRYSYSSGEAGAITALISSMGTFTASKEIRGHENLRNSIREISRDEPIPDYLITNVSTMVQVKSVGGKEYRLWPKFKIFSAWDVPPKDNISGIIALFDKLGEDIAEYRFDIYTEQSDGIYEDMMDYNSFMKAYSGLSEEEKAAQAEAERERSMKEMDRKRLAADYALGVNKKPAQGFYRREGD